MNLEASVCVLAHFVKLSLGVASITCEQAFLQLTIALQHTLLKSVKWEAWGRVSRATLLVRMRCMH